MENRIWEIIAASIHGEELSQEEISTLQVWLDENKQNRDEYARLQIFYAENKGGLKDNINVQRAWEDNCARRKAGKMIRLRRQIVRWGYAAVVTLAIGVGVLLLTEKDDEQAVKVEFVESQIVPGSPKAVLTLASGEELDLQEEGQFVSKDSSRIRNVGNVLEYEAGVKKHGEKKLEYNTLTIPRGGEYQLKLEDGTNVWLNAETELRFPVAFGDSERRIFLKGEAYFDVIKSKEWPFIVRTCRSSVKVLGTSFNVCSYEEDALEQVTLEQGGVEVKHHDETYLLHPGEQFELDTRNEEIEVKPVNVKLYTSWIDGMFRFHNMPLDLLTVKLERWYNVHFVFSNEVCKNYRFTGAIRKDVDFNEFIRLIERTTNVKFIIKQKNIIIQEK